MTLVLWDCNELAWFFLWSVFKKTLSVKRGWELTPLPAAVMLVLKGVESLDEVSIMNTIDTPLQLSCEWRLYKMWSAVTDCSKLDVKVGYSKPLICYICIISYAILIPLLVVRHMDESTRRTYLIIGVRQDRTLSCRVGGDCERKEVKTSDWLLIHQALGTAWKNV